MAGLPRPFHFFRLYHLMVLQPRICRNISGLGSFPFARHYSGNHSYFLFLRLLRCFSSARSRSVRHVFNMSGFPIRKSPDQVSFADPRCLSQLITSFFASESLGIPRVPFLTFFSLYPFAVQGCFLYIVMPLLRNTTSLLLSSLVFFLPICQRTFSSPLISPVRFSNVGFHPEMSVENNGFEPLTPCVQGRCSSQLS